MGKLFWKRPLGTQKSYIQMYF